MPNLNEDIYQAELKVKQAQEELAKLRAQVQSREVDDYVFTLTEGRTINLSELFGDHRDLILVHNMGTKCPYCTLWADEYNGVLPHLENRTSFVVSSPDAPEVQEEFAKGRGWDFPMVSVEGNTFAQDMGFHEEAGDFPGYQPGCSIFRKQDDSGITRVSQASFGPGDQYCSVWHFFDLLQDGADGWGPKLKY